MNTKRRSPALLPLLAALAGAVLIAALYLVMRANREPAADAPGIELAGATIGGPFRLSDQNGRTVTDANLRGKYTLVYFGYSFCPDVCPTDVQRMSVALSAFERAEPGLAAKVQPVFVTVDPERDTAAALKAFASNFHPRLIALTGTPSEIEAAKGAYRIYAAKRPAERAGEYLMDHSAVTYLFGPDGKPLGGLDSRGSAVELRRMLDYYVR